MFIAKCKPYEKQNGSVEKIWPIRVFAERNKALANLKKYLTVKTVCNVRAKYTYTHTRAYINRSLCSK